MPKYSNISVFFNVQSKFMSAPPSLIFVIDSLAMGGGAESSFLNLASAVSNSCCEPILLVTLKRVVSSRRISTLNISSNLLVYEFPNPLALALYLLFRHTAKRTILISALTRSTLLCLFFALIGFNHIISFRSDVALDYRNKMVLWFFSCLSVCFCDFAIFLSRRAQYSFYHQCKSDFPFLGISPRKLSFIHNSMSTPLCPNLHLSLNSNITAIADFFESKKRLSICIVSRLIESKGVRQFIYNYSSFLSLTNIHLNIYGEGPLRGDIHRLVKHCSLDSNVTLHGHVTNISEALQSNNVFLFTSMHEGFVKAPL